MLELLRSIARSDGVGVVCSLHQVDFARAFADRIVGLSKGTVLVDVPAKLFDEDAFVRLYGRQAGASEPAAFDRDMTP